MGVKFPNGQRTLVYQQGPPQLFWRVNVDDDGMDTPIGRYGWLSGEGRYVKGGSQKIERASDTQYAAIDGANNYDGLWS